MRKFIIFTICISLSFIMAFGEPNLSPGQSVLFAFLICGFIYFGINTLVYFVQFSIGICSYKTLRELVEFHQKQRAEKEKEILIMMQFSRSFPATLKEIEQIFKENRKLKLHRYKPFRAWYKHHKESEKRDPEFYNRLLAAGMIPHEEDPYYDSKAPAWEQFELKRTYFDDDDYDDDHSEKSKKDSASDWIYRGIGFGLMNSILNSGGGDGGAASGSSN